LPTIPSYSAALHGLPRTKDTVFWKALAAIANCFAGRGCEILSLSWKDVCCVTDAEGAVSYKIKYARVKKMTSNTTDSEYALLTCADGVEAVTDYISCFPLAGRLLPENRAVSTTYIARNIYR
jgi:hypothetical protein